MLLIFYIIKQTEQDRGRAGIKKAHPDSQDELEYIDGKQYSNDL